jgi:hypothetical protein
MATDWRWRFVIGSVCGLGPAWLDGEDTAPALARIEDRSHVKQLIPAAAGALRQTTNPEQHVNASHSGYSLC